MGGILRASRLAALGAAALYGQETPEGVAPTWEALEARGAHFSAVDLRIRDVFDPSRPKENHWIGRAANVLHLETKKRVVLREIPFKPGDPVTARAVREAERNLRDFRFIKEASIRPVVEADGRVRAVVETRDAWTLRASGGFNQVGGQRNFGFSVKESNFLGFGKELTAQHEKTTERTVETLLYRDRQFLGSHWTLIGRYQQLSDGRTRWGELERPFRNLDTPFGASFSLWSTDSTLSLYNLQRVAFTLPTVLDSARAEASWAVAVHGDHAHRLGGGVESRRARYGTVTAVEASGLAVPETTDRRLLGAYASWHFFQDGYRAFQDLAGMTHPEDYNLGWDAKARIGFYTKAFGSTVDAPFLESTLEKGWLPRPDILLLLKTAGSGRREPGGWRDALLSASLTAYYQGFRGQTQAAYLQVDAVNRPAPESRLYLGGFDGMRGYANHLLAGDRRWMLSLEERPITAVNWLGILQLGFVLYADVGAIRRLDTGRWSRTYANVGGGLRFGDLKSSLGRIVLITVATPLVREPGLDRYQLVVGNIVKF